MQRFEYKVVPAPKKGEKAKGARNTPDRFAVALMNVMNRLGAEGWDYVRADTLPCDERVGLTGSKTEFQNMLVFRRALPGPKIAKAGQTFEVPTEESAAKPVAVPAPAANSTKIPKELFEDPEPESDMVPLSILTKLAQKSDRPTEKQAQTTDIQS